MTETYMTKTKRDARARELKAQGIATRKSSLRNQLCHPMYVKDFPRQLDKDECGFGNTIYRTHFLVLYTLDW
jgi:hypothetical protein